MSTNKDKQAKNHNSEDSKKIINLLIIEPQGIQAFVEQLDKILNNTCTFS